MLFHSQVPEVPGLSLHELLEPYDCDSAEAPPCACGCPVEHHFTARPGWFYYVRSALFPNKWYSHLRHLTVDAVEWHACRGDCEEVYWRPFDRFPHIIPCPGFWRKS